MDRSDNTKDKSKSLKSNSDLSKKIKSVAGKEASATRNNEIINNFLVEGIRPVIFDWNVETGKVSKSDSSSEYVLFDNTLPEIFNNTIADGAVHPDDLIKFADAVREHTENGSPRVETTVRLKKTNGIFVFCRLTFTYFLSDSGRLKRAIGTLREVNISDTAADIQLKALTSYMAAGVLMVEVRPERLAIIYTSESYHRIMGITKAELRVYENEPTKAINAEDFNEINNRLRNAIKNDEIYDCVYRVTHKGVLSWRHAIAVKIPYDKSDYPVFIAVLTDITTTKLQEQALKTANDRINLAFSQLSTSVWELDFETNKLTLWVPFDDCKISIYTFDDLEKNLIEAGIIHPDSVKDFLQYVRLVKGGEHNGKTALVLRDFSGKYIWSGLTHIVITDDNGQPVKAIGTQKKLPNIVDEKTQFEQETLVQKALQSKLFAISRVNLSTDMVEMFYFDGNDRMSALKNPTYSEYLNLSEKSVFGESDKFAFTKKFSKASLVESFEKGNRWFSFDYKRKDKSGSIVWYTTLVHLLANPLTDDLYAFGYTAQVNERKERELALPQRIERDSNAMVYTKETVKAFVSSFVDTEKEKNKLCAFLIIDVNGINDIKENVGINIASRVIFLIGRLFRLLYDNSGIIGRMRDDRFSVFFPDVLSAADAEQRAKELIGEIQTSFALTGISEKIDFSVGISALSYSDASFSSLYDSADKALEGNKLQLQGSQFAVFDAQKQYSDDDAFLVLSEGRFVEKEFAIDSKIHNETMLSSFFSCASHIANDSDIDHAMMNLLSETASYYKCDRVYILGISSDLKTVKALHEWHKPVYHSTRDLSKSTPVDELPAVKKALSSLHTVALQSVSIEREKHQHEKVFISSPVLKNSKVVGFICVDNPTRHSDDIALVYSITSLLSVLDSLSNPTEPATGIVTSDLDPQTGLLNRTRYWRDVTSILPDTLSSLGVMFADVNGLKLLNKSHGTEYGDSLIMFISNELKDIFGNANVYRISGDEFVALMKNITNEELLKLTDRFRNDLEFTHPGTISLGSTWADATINALKMIDHAESLMHIEKQAHYRRQEEVGDRERPAVLKSLQNSINGGLFKIYLQPKADIKTGEIVGAEALVRLFDQNQGIVSPDKFIPLFEREQVIKHIDFFVLDNTLKIMSEWKRLGKRLLPVSVNFSRNTLLDPTSLAYTLDICSRYDLPLNMIEIEITESIGNIERATVSSACEQFTKQGFLLSLDDFGSEYSSLSVLSSINFHSLKLDKAIISDISTNKMSRYIVENTIRLCKEAGMISVAEGVETEEQLEQLKEIGCDIAQGYLFNKPIPPEDFEEKYLN